MPQVKFYTIGLALKISQARHPKACHRNVNGLGHHPFIEKRDGTSSKLDQLFDENFFNWKRGEKILKLHDLPFAGMEMIESFANLKSRYRSVSIHQKFFFPLFFLKKFEISCRCYKTFFLRR
jgi:hypothetical protein